MCEDGYFLDESTKDCLPCLLICDREITMAECKIKCPDYVQRVDVTKTNDSLYVGHSEAPSLLSTIVMIISIVLFLTIAVMVFFMVRYHLRTKHHQEQDIKCLNETEALTTFGFGPISYESQKRYSLPSLSRAGHSISFPNLRTTKPSSLTISSLTNKDLNLLVPSQETVTENVITKTLVKSQSCYSLSHSSEIKQPVQAAISLDLQEDFDFVDQVYGNSHGGSNELGVIADCVDNSSQNKNHIINISLQRLSWVKQVWWDSEGAKVAVDASHLETGEERIKSILRQQGVSSQDFSFQIVLPHVFM